MGYHSCCHLQPQSILWIFIVSIIQSLHFVGTKLFPFKFKIFFLSIHSGISLDLYLLNPHFCLFTNGFFLVYFGLHNLVFLNHVLMHFSIINRGSCLRMVKSICILSDFGFGSRKADGNSQSGFLNSIALRFIPFPSHDSHGFHLF